MLNFGLILREGSEFMRWGGGGEKFWTCHEREGAKNFGRVIIGAIKYERITKGAIFLFELFSRCVKTIFAV